MSFCSYPVLNVQMSLDAIKSFLSAVQSIVLQQEEEVNQRKKTEKLERKLQREMNSLTEMEIKFSGNLANEETETALSPKHPLSTKRTKFEVLKKQVENEKERYKNSVRATQTMILNNLQTSLPNVFRALFAYSSTYSQSLQAVLNCGSETEQEGDSSISFQY